MIDQCAISVINTHAILSAKMWLLHTVHSIIHVGSDPTNIFSPHSTPAYSIYGLSMLVLVISSGIFLIVAGLLIFVLFRFRHRPGDSEDEPAQIYGSRQIEILWTVVPILIVVVLFLATARVISMTEQVPKPANALNVVVIAHQFWWEYRYPKLGIITANELHIPLSTAQHPRPTYMTMSSADVDHSWWVPELAGKKDLIPNKVNVMWIEPTKPGIYLGQCAQYCGEAHAQMLIRVYVDPPAKFAKWVANQQKPAVRDPETAEGRRIFEHTSCVSCHRIAGTSAQGTFGPDLTHFASRDTFASGSIKNTRQNLRKWIEDPNAMKPGCLMPKMNLSRHDLDAITDYIASLR